MKIFFLSNNTKMTTVPVSLKKTEVSFIDTTPKRRGRKRKLESGSDHIGKRAKKGEEEPASSSSSTDRVQVKANLAIELPKLEEWDPSKLPPGFFVILEGKRRTGKSTFATWLLQWYIHRFSLVWCMSQTSLSGYWQKRIGKEFVFDGYYPDAINAVLARNDKIIGEHGEESKITAATADTLIIFDDCITKEIWNSDQFIKLAVEGRHHRMSFIFITQDPKTVRPCIRDNADVCVVFNQKTMRNKMSIWEDFMMDVDKNTAFALLAKYAVNHDALVCEQSNLDGVITKNFYKSTGDKTKLEDPNYILGGPTQKALIVKEKAQAKANAQARKLAEKADKRPVHNKVPDDMKAATFTVEAMMGL
jgi:hypothetical protein